MRKFEQVTAHRTLLGPAYNKFYNSYLKNNSNLAGHPLSVCSPRFRKYAFVGCEGSEGIAIYFLLKRSFILFLSTITNNKIL